MQRAPLISVIIPVRNEGLRIKEAILSFIYGRSTLFAIEFIIVDDASNDGCCDDVKNLSEQNSLCSITVIKLDDWSGIPFARNIGAKQAAAPILVITDANVKACNGWDIPVFREIQPGTVLCSTIADKDSEWKGYGCFLNLPSMAIKWLRNPGSFYGYVPVSPCTGTVIYKNLFMRLGGYDTAMPVYGAAEPEFSIRIWLYGGQIKNVPDLIFYHRFRPKEERIPFLDQINLIQVKNYLRFGLLYLQQNDVANLFNYWHQENPNVFNEAIKQLDQTEIYARRYHLKRHLRHDLEWLKRRFMYQ
jgi:glycosyltransferase involved in cell wall biosynthesis